MSVPEPPPCPGAVICDNHPPPQRFVECSVHILHTVGTKSRLARNPSIHEDTALDVHAAPPRRHLRRMTEHSLEPVRRDQRAHTVPAVRSGDPGS